MQITLSTAPYRLLFLPTIPSLDHLLRDEYGRRGRHAGAVGQERRGQVAGAKGSLSDFGVTWKESMRTSLFEKL